MMRPDRGAEASVKFGAGADARTPGELAAIVRADLGRYRAIVRSAGFMAEG